MRKSLTGLALLAAALPISAKQAPAQFDWFEYRGDDELPKPGAGEYANPILQGFYPDPSIVRVGRDYYLVNSTFAWFPGMPIFHSRDLVHWTQIGNAIDRPSQLDLTKTNMGLGLYAPDISFHDRKFYILNTCVACGGNFVITAKRPEGPWSDPAWLPGVNGIDTSLFFDDDGSAWIVHNGPPPEKPKYEGHTAIWLQQFDARTLKTFGKPEVLVDQGTHPERNPIWIEGPHIFKKDEVYYLIAAEGGTAEQHSEVVFRSDKVTGPYVPLESNPILTQRDLPDNRAHPITSTGHAKFVDTPEGEWWAVFLGVRPYDSAGDFNTGRETFMMPVRWSDGWPRITNPGQVVPWTAPVPKLPQQAKPAVPTHGDFTFREEFNSPKLAPYWMQLRNPTGRWWRLGHGALQLDARPAAIAGEDNPSLLARRQQHQNATVTTAVRFRASSDAAEAGIVAYQNDAHWYFLTVGSTHGKPVVRVRRRNNDDANGVIIGEAPLRVSSAAPVQLRISARGPSYDFAWSADGRRWHTLIKDADGTILSTQKAGGFVGAVFGLYAHDGKQKPEIAMTIDDLPVHGPYPPGLMPLDVNRQMIAALKDAHVPVTGFVNAVNIKDAGTMQALREWRAAGFVLGNHSWSHPHLSELTLGQFETELTRDEPILKKLGATSDWHWFRYPFIDEGRDEAQRVAARQVLSKHGYRVADVTTGFSDWAWTPAYARCTAKHDAAGVAELEQLYLTAVKESIADDREAARLIYGRDIPYVLLMHVSAMSAHMMPQVLQTYRDAGYRFVSLPEAEGDPAYRNYTDLRLPPPPTRTEAAKARGVKLPTPPDYSAKLNSICA